MKSYQIAGTDLAVSRIALGCMNLGGTWDSTPLTQVERTRTAKVIQAACEGGIALFDHADIYARGKSEAVFGEVLNQQPGLRDRIVLQSKCGIRFAEDPAPGVVGRYDFSYEHIIHSVEGSLRRLKTTHLDILLLHRPDPLVEPSEVARAFDELQTAGKVRFFGVSNHTPLQIELLRKFVDQPLVINQLELNILHSHMIDDGIMANQEGGRYTAAAGILDYCRLHDIHVQAWAPLANGKLISPPAKDDDRVQQAARVVARLAQEKQTSREAIALAWLLRHPARIQPLVGTTNPDRVKSSCLADEVTLTREEWYELFVAGRGAPAP